jgi:CheY-like chemotaxis protein
MKCELFGNATVPIARPLVERKNSQVAEPLHPFRILYVEDETEILRFASCALSRRGYHVTCAKDGLQGWHSLHTEKFDLLITDNDMPRMTGLELVEKVRASGIDIPIIVASGSASSLEQPKYKWLNLSACIQKPFTFDELLFAVNHAFDSRPLSHPISLSAEVAKHLLETVPHQDWGLNE